MIIKRSLYQRMFAMADRLDRQAHEQFTAEMKKTAAEIRKMKINYSMMLNDPATRDWERQELEKEIKKKVERMKALKQQLGEESTKRAEEASVAARKAGKERLNQYHAELERKEKDAVDALEKQIRREQRAAQQAAAERAAAERLAQQQAAERAAKNAVKNNVKEGVEKGFLRGKGKWALGAAALGGLGYAGYRHYAGNGKRG